MVVARHFSAGNRGHPLGSPGGTAELLNVSAVPPGLGRFSTALPGTEVPGYFHRVPAGRLCSNSVRC